MGFLFNGSHLIEPKQSRDDTLIDISSTPHIWYTTVTEQNTTIGKIAISQNDVINAYIATNCIDSNASEHEYIYHTPRAGSINIINATNDNFNDVDVGGSSMDFSACSYSEIEGASALGEDNISVSYGGVTKTIPLPKNGGIIDVVIFPDYTFDYYAVKAFKG